MEEYLPELESRIAARPPCLLNHAVLGLARAEIGDLDGTRREWDTLASRLDELPASWDRGGAMALVGELLSVAGDAERAPDLYERLHPHAGLFVSAPAPIFLHMAADRALCLLAATAGDLEAAERHFQAAIALEERLRAFVLASRTRYEYARALLSAGGRHEDRAETLLRDALDKANQLGLVGLARAIQRYSAEVAPQV